MIQNANTVFFVVPGYFYELAKVLSIKPYTFTYANQCLTNRNKKIFIKVQPLSFPFLSLHTVVTKTYGHGIFLFR